MSDSPVLMDMLTTQMRYTTQRQSILAQNVSNIDTPGYKAKDLKKLDFAKILQEHSSASGKLAMTGTSPAHLQTAGAGESPFAVLKIKPNETSPTGNSVSLEDEMAKVSTTSTQFQESSLLFKKYTQLLHTAIGSR